MKRQAEPWHPAPWWVALLGLIAYAVVAGGVLFVGWYVLIAFLGMGSYIQSAP